MKALSVKNPYAGLIAAGIKNVENRSWTTNFVGALAICSSQKPDSEKYVRETRAKVARLGEVYPERLCSLNGYVLAVVDFRSLVWLAEDGRFQTDHPTFEREDLSEWWQDEMIGWIFENARALPHPIPVKGRLGLWTLPPEIEQAVLEQIRTLD